MFEWNVNLLEIYYALSFYCSLIYVDNPLVGMYFYLSIFTLNIFHTNYNIVNHYAAIGLQGIICI